MVYKFKNLEEFDSLVETAKFQILALEKILDKIRNFEFEMVLVDDDQPGFLVKAHRQDAILSEKDKIAERDIPHLEDPGHQYNTQSE